MAAAPTPTPKVTTSTTNTAAFMSAFAGITGIAGSILAGETAALTQETNIAIARSQQRILAARRKLEKSRDKKRAKQFLGRQNALFAKAGVTLEGSPIDVIEDSARELEFDSIIKDINANIENSRLESEIGQRGFAARTARAGGIRRAGTTLLETAADVFGKIPKTETKGEK